MGPSKMGDRILQTPRKAGDTASKDVLTFA